MEERELVEGASTESKVKKPEDNEQQVRNEEWKIAIEILLGTNPHEEITEDEASDLITAARSFRKIIDALTKIFGGNV